MALIKTEKEIKKMTVSQYTAYIKKLDSKIDEFTSAKTLAKSTWSGELKEVTPKKKKK